MARRSEEETLQLDEAKAMARRVIAHHFDEKPQRIVYQPSGISNFVFLVKHKEGEFVVRLSPEGSKMNAFIKEQWAMGKAREAGVPVPDVLEVGIELVPFPYMISRKVRGQEATFHPNRMQIVHEMGRYAARINSIPTAGFGATFDWSSNQLSQNAAWEDFLQKELRLDARLKVLERLRMISPSRCNRIRSTLEGAAGPSCRPSLNHGDIRLKNVMVDEDGLIVAIIDWEQCVSNIAPQWELSLALHDLSIDEKHEFLEGYGLREGEVNEIAPVIKALNLINYAPKIERLAEAKETARLERYRLRLSGALDLYAL